MLEIARSILKPLDMSIEFFDRGSGLQSLRGHHFLDRLNAQSTVIDLGAHKGEFCLEIRQRYAARCFLVEANPGLFAGIPEGPLVRKVNVAICGQDGPVRLFLSSNPEATSLNQKISTVWGTQDAIEIRGVRFETLLNDLSISTIDLLKVDIEGSEIEMFHTTSDSVLRKIDQISIEFHSFLDPQFKAEILQIEDRLRKLGFMRIPFPDPGKATADLDTLFLNMQRLKLTFKENLYLMALSVPLKVRTAFVALLLWKNQSRD
jgi:FkbM family methyltransferase